MDSRVVRLIESLGLEPHPEGGFYREFFRSPLTVAPDDGRGARSALTAIYFLLPGGSLSRWHVVSSDEQWSHLGGAVELLTIDPSSGRLHTHKLGPVGEGRKGVVMVPAGHWQAARPHRSFGLVVCTTGPGFDFADFRLLAEDPTAAGRIRDEWPRLAELL